MLSILVVYLTAITLAGWDAKWNVFRLLNDSKNKQLSVTSHVVGSNPFTEFEECDSLGSLPLIVGYHIHITFNGEDEQTIKAAMESYRQFREGFSDEDIQDCQFSHSYGNMETMDICSFPIYFDEQVRISLFILT